MPGDDDRRGRSSTRADGRARADDDEARIQFHPGAGDALPRAGAAQGAQAEMLDWQGSGMSVMEVSHRSKAFVDVRRSRPRPTCASCSACPANYKVLFLQGGATAQFAAVPLNLAPRRRRPPTTSNTGAWSQEGRSARPSATSSVNVAADERRVEVTPTVPDPQACASSRRAPRTCTTRRTRPSAAWSSTTFPRRSDVPLVADMSLDASCRGRSTSRRFGAHLRRRAEEHRPRRPRRRHRARRPARPRAPRDAGRHRLQGDGRRTTRCEHAADLRWYFAGLVFQWLKEQGGLAAMEERNARKAAKLYAAIDGSGFYKNPVATKRSLVDERAVHAGQARSSTSRSCDEAQGRGPRESRRATASSAACARASTTRCPKPASTRWSEFMARLRRSGADTGSGMRSRSGRSTTLRSRGLERLPRDRYEVASEIGQARRDPAALGRHARHGVPDSVLRRRPRRRRHQQHSRSRSSSKRGIPVFNAPGANANAVKELVIAGPVPGGAQHAAGARVRARAAERPATRSTRRSSRARNSSSASSCRGARSASSVSAPSASRSRTPRSSWA